MNQKNKNSLKKNAIGFFVGTISKATNVISSTKVLAKKIVKNPKHCYKVSILPITKTKYNTFMFENMQILSFNNVQNDTIVYLHGGAFVDEPILQHYFLAEEIAKKTNCRVDVVIYPLLPYGNAKMCVELLQKYVLSFGNNVILAGDSAGATLALATYHALSQGGMDNLVKKIVLVSPWLDLALTSEQIKEQQEDIILNKKFLQRAGKMWAGETDINNPICSPMYIKNVTVKTLIVCGTNEILEPDIKQFCKNKPNVKLAEYEKMQHDFILYPIKNAKIAKKQIVDFINND